MDTTVASAVSAARNRLLPLVKLSLNELGATLATDATTVTLADEPHGITAEGFMAIGYEVVYVVSPPSGRDVEVYRAMLGTSQPTTPHPAGTLVEAKTRYPPGIILQALLEEVRAMGPDLYKPTPAVVTGAAGVAGYDLGLMDWTQIHDVLRVYARPSTNDTSFQGRRMSFDFRRIGPADLCPSGTAALQLHSPLGDARTLDVTYAAPFDTSAFDETTDLVADCGLAASMFDVAWLGSAYRLLQEAPRTQLATQSIPPKAEDVPAGLVTSVRGDLLSEYKRRKTEEMALLLRRYPR